MKKGPRSGCWQQFRENGNTTNHFDEGHKDQSIKDYLGCPTHQAWSRRGGKLAPTHGLIFWPCRNKYRVDFPFEKDGIK